VSGLRPITARACSLIACQFCQETKAVQCSVESHSNHGREGRSGLSAEHFAYLAGIIDGEGTITILQHRQHNRNTLVLRPRLSAANNHHGLLETIRQRHGGTLIINHRKPKPNKKPSYVWRICGAKELHEIIGNVLPYLIVKAVHAEVMMNYLESRISARANNVHAGYASADIAAFETLKEMNRRGSHEAKQQGREASPLHP
jgi:hypothetical protein